MEAGFSESLRGIAATCIQVEIPADQEHRRIAASMAVLQDLSQLTEAKGIVAFAFQMKVVGHQRPAIYVCLRYQCDPAAGPSLKDSEVGHTPSRLPKVRLVAKPDHFPI
jgi:hypothetical protein